MTSTKRGRAGEPKRYILLTLCLARNLRILFIQQITDENGNGEKEVDAKTEKHEKIVVPRGTVLKLKGIPSGIDRDEIKKSFVNYPADIAYVEITPDNIAFVRLRGENDGKLVC